MLYRPGAGVLHRAPDGISRNPEGRDKLLVARSSEWKNQRARIRGVREAIEQGDFDDDEPELREISSVPTEDLRPIPRARANVKDDVTERIKEAVEANKAREKAAESKPAVKNEASSVG